VGCPGGFRWLTRVGWQELIFCSKVLNAHQAHQIGLVDKVAKEGQTALDCALDLAREILPAGPLAIQAAKLAIDRGEGMDLQVAATARVIPRGRGQQLTTYTSFRSEAGLDFEHAAYNSLIKTSDRLEGLTAYVA